MNEFKRPNQDPDLEVELLLLSTDQGGRKYPLWQGCRLPHDFGLPEEMNDGMYEFFGVPPAPGENGRAFIWLLVPERNKSVFILDLNSKFGMADLLAMVK